MYGCNNSARQAGYWVPIRVFKSGIPEHGKIWIKDDSSRECRYDMRATDAKCQGCQK